MLVPASTRQSPYRRALLRGALGAVLLLTIGCGLPSAPIDGPPSDLPVAPLVKLGSGGSVYDAAVLLAARRGYFREQGLTVEIVSFPSLAAVLPPVVAGQLDAGTVPPSVDLFEALGHERAAPRIVASAGQAWPHFSPAAFLLRPDLAGLKPAQVRGRAIAVDLYGPAGYTFDLALARLGLHRRDVYVVDLPPERAAEALGESQLDAAYVVEPEIAALVSEHRAVTWMSVGDLDPGQEMALLLYSPNLAAHRRSIGTRLLSAYLRGQQDYRAALGSSAGRAALRAELADALGLDSPRSGEELSLVLYPADGQPNLASLAALEKHYARRHLLERRVDFAQAIDPSFLRAAAQRAAASVAPAGR